MSLRPGLVLFFPEFDQVYATFAALLVGSWVLTLRRHSWRFAAICGLVLRSACFLAFNLLVLGVVMALAALYLWLGAGQTSVRQVLICSAIVAGIGVAFYVLLWLMIGYDVVETFRQSANNQDQLAAVLNRPYPDTAVFDLWDFAMGVGWISAVAFLGALPRRSEVADPLRAFTWITLLQILIIAVGAFLPAETARLWIFLFPLVAVAVGREIADWSARQRL
jgi:hypothetical protein